ncbi:hypothetical protein ABPG72_015853 [Tetrahymena utriculariae]
MSNKNMIQSMVSNLQEFNDILTKSGINCFQSFVIGFVCGLDSDTENIQQHIEMIKQVCKTSNLEEQEDSQFNDRRQNGDKKQENIKNNNEEQFESTPPLNDINLNQQSDEWNNQGQQKESKSSKGNFYLQGQGKKSKPDQSMSDYNDSNGFNKNDRNKSQKESNSRTDYDNDADEQNSDFDVQQYMKQFQNYDEDEQKTLELIRQLQEEEEQDINMKNNEDDDIECPICMCELYTESVLALENCDHVFHKECLLEYLKNKIQDRKAQILCPDEKCKTEILVEDFKQLLGKEMYDNYVQYSLQSYVDEHGDEMSWCPTADCKYVFAFDENEDDAFFKCPMCKKEYCLKCRVIFHKGMTCKEYEITNKKDENDAKFEKFVKGKKFKQCIKCKFWVEKNQGCDHMTCRCKYEFCYKCGGKYRECECVQKFKEQQERLQQRRLARQQQKALKKPKGAPRARGRRAQN